MSVGSDFVKGNRAAKQQASKRKLWYIVLAVICSVVALFFASRILYHHLQQRDKKTITLPAKKLAADNKKLPLASAKPNAVDSKLKPDSFNKDSTDVKYDFYKLLSEAQMRPSATPMPLASAAPNENFWVQVSASKSLADIRRLRSRLRSAGYPVNVMQQQGVAGPWYRVLLGPYVERSGANSALKRLRVAGLDGYITSRGVTTPG